MVEDKENTSDHKREGDLPGEEKGYVEVIPTDKEKREGEDYLLEEELPIEKIAADERSEDLIEKQKRFVENDAIAEDLARRQSFAYGGRREIEGELEQRHAASPDLAAGDVDADWGSASTGSGAETVGGTEPTPDQDVVDEIGEAVGITYEDDEPLNIEKKMRQRRERRLEPPRDKEREFPPERENMASARSEEEA